MKVVGIVVICLLLLAPSSFAGENGGIEEWYLYPSLQYFSWEESSGGRRILKEEGPFFGFGGGMAYDLYQRRLILRARGEMFGSEVHYRGQTQPLPSLPSPPNAPDTPNPQSERPVRTHVVYFGTKLESDLGWRIPVASGTFEPFAGIGYRWWLRDLQSTTAIDTAGNSFAVGGYTEVWHTLYSRLGLRGSYPASGDLNFFAEAGAKYPFLNWNIADFPGSGTVTVKPDPRWSVFAEIGARYGNFRPTVFYEGFRFGQSPKVPIVLNGGKQFLLQPDSESDIIGINLGWAFR